MRTSILLALAFCLAGCTRLRFVIDAIPAEDALTETIVLEDDRAGLDFAPDQKIALIDVSGLLIDTESRGLLNSRENPIARFAEALRRAEKDDRVRAIIVRINSPGGAVTASDVMYRELNRFRETTKIPVVILMADVAASGGYYLACAGDEIIAHPTTITGSIGVIMQMINFSEGMKRIGIHADAITSGPNKAAGSPFEPMPQEHRELFQNIVNEMYANFRTVVTTNRAALKEADLERVTDGRIVTGRQAAEVGLVDALGDLHDAFDAAKKRAGLTSATLVKYHRPLEHVGSAYAESPTGAPMSSTQINLLQVNLEALRSGESFGFYYLWDPAAW